MSLNETPTGERVHIGFFGRRNAGKSSLVNAVAGQGLSVVSDVLGTTTDPVRKTMELLPMGPVVVIDTPGFDDEGELGEKRVQKTEEILKQCDIAVLVVDARIGITEADERILKEIKKRDIPWIIAWNKSDRPEALPAKEDAIALSALTGENISLFKERLARLAPAGEKRELLADIVRPGESVILVCPIDESAPKGRLILPQQQVIRALLDVGASAVICKDTELEASLAALRAAPGMVITDSQAFQAVAKIVPDDVLLTSFSILMARYKGYLEQAVSAIQAISCLQDGDRVLMAEGCTHHRQCNDIGTVKIPAWLRRYTKKDLAIETCSGREFPADLGPYKLVVHCGACMLTENQVRARMEQAREQNVPCSNYGILIAYINGILKRSLRPFPKIHELLEESR